MPICPCAIPLPTFFPMNYGKGKAFGRKANALPRTKDNFLDPMAEFPVIVMPCCGSQSVVQANQENDIVCEFKTAPGNRAVFLCRPRRVSDSPANVMSRFIGQEIPAL